MYVPTLQNTSNGYGAAVGTACGSAAMGSAIGGQAVGQMARDYWPDEYPSIMYGALAHAVDVGYPNAELAYDRLAARTNPVESPSGYEFDPTFAIVPRSIPKKVIP
jgi:hypothetical protein